MLRKTVGMSRVLQKLPAAPGLSEIHHYLSQAMEKRGKQVVISWPTPDRALDFTLEILFPIRGGDTEWNLYSGADRKKELLWEYKTCDVLLVYNLIVSSCGEVNRTVVADGAISVSESFRDQSKKRDTYYMQAMQTQMVDNVKLASLGLKDNSWSRGTTEMVGDLSLIQIPNLFQSINVAKMTGCLEVIRKDDKAQVYFVDGEPVYAEMPMLVGDECILELVTIREGKYEFHPRARTQNKNVQQNIESLVMRGVQLKDRISYLKNAGLWPESVVSHKNPNLTRQEFDARCSYNPPVSLNLLRNLFTSIDDHTSLKKIVNKLQIPTSVWVPAVCYLLEQDLITFSNEVSNNDSDQQHLIPKNIDKTAIHSVMMGLRRPETGMFTYPAFLYFLEQEYFRGYRSGSPLSVMVMEMREVKGPPDFARQPLGVEAVAEVFRRISQLKRHIDLLAHYEQYDYAMILPNTKSAGANVFAQRIVSALLSKPLPGGIDSSKLSLSFGIACIPEDCVDLSYILAAAESAKAQAILLAAPVIIYRDIRVEAESAT